MTDLQPWIAEIPSALLVLVALTLPGAIISWTLGLSPRRYPLTVPLLSMTLIASIPILAAFLGVPWGWGTLFTATLLMAGLILLFQVCIRRRIKSIIFPTFSIPSARILKRVLLLSLPLLAASLLIAYPFMSAMGTPATPPQTWDAVFHINAVEWIFRTGNASTLDMAAVSGVDAQPGFYPAGWHDLVSLLYQGDAIVASNMTILVVASILWPLGATLLGRTIAGNTPWILLLTPFMAATFTSFPERPASYGTLWPTVLAYTLVPYLAALLIALFDDETTDRWQLLVVVLGSLPGIGISHPTAVFATLIITVWVLPIHFWRIYSGQLEVSRVWKIFITVLTGLFVLLFAFVTRSKAWESVTSYESRGSVGSGRWALWEAMTDAQYSYQGYGDADPTYALAIVTLIGGVLVARTRHRRFLILSWLVLLALYFESVVAWDVFQAFIAPWYSDPVRIGGMLPLLTAPFAGIGFSWLVESAASFVSVKFPSWNGRLVTLLLPLLLLGFFAIDSARFGMNEGAHQLQKNYKQEYRSGFNALILDNEIAMMKRVGQSIKPDELILGDPMNGSPLFYSVAHANTYFRHLLPITTSDTDRVFVGLSFPHPPAVTCRFLQENNIHYFYEDRFLYWPEAAEEFKLSRELRDVNPRKLGFEQVDTGGGATLWRITTCDLDG